MSKDKKECIPEEETLTHQNLADQSTLTPQNDTQVNQENIQESLSTEELLKEIGTSLIPVYGTIKEFKKGNIGWGIFGIVADTAMLIPVVGAGLKAGAAAIRGGSIAVRAARAGAAAADVGALGTHAVVKQFATGATEELLKSSSEVGTAIVRAIDPGVELLYTGGKAITTKAPTLIKTVTKASQEIPHLLDPTVWKSFDAFDAGHDLMSLMNQFQDRFKLLLYSKKLDKQFLSDFPRSDFKINGKLIKRDAPEKMLAELEKEIPELQTRQLLSAYANQSILADPYTRLFSKAEDFAHYASENNRVLYDAVTLPRGKILLKIENTDQLRWIPETGKADVNYSDYGLKINLILSDERIPVHNYFYFINTSL